MIQSEENNASTTINPRDNIDPFKKTHTMEDLRCWAEINLSALQDNVNFIRNSFSDKMHYISVVKADAYGHGLSEIVDQLVECNIDFFAVANVQEARAIRMNHCKVRILLLSPILPHEEAFIIHDHLIPTISSEDEAKRFQSLAINNNQKIPVHLKIDTGMGRLGVWYQEAIPLYHAIMAASHLQLEGICTHFSSSDINPAFTDEQRQRFFSVLKNIPRVILDSLMIHADNSAATYYKIASMHLPKILSPQKPDLFNATTFLNTEKYKTPEKDIFNAMRVGLIQFGVHPFQNESHLNHLFKPVLSLYTRIGMIKTLPLGSTISYGSTYTLKRDSRLAILTAGYADGISTRLSNTGYVLIRGHRCPIRGRVTMDQTIVDITDIPMPNKNAQSEISIGEKVILIGNDISDSSGKEPTFITAKEFSEWTQSIPWEIFCSMSKRVSRIYV